jgi:Asp-tRNA(Asn)/Glu-tRNA(Gln) amidotransferase A subunit family amidase
MGPHRYSWMTVEELAPRIWSGELDVVELVEETLDGVRRHNSRLRAFITVLEERARSRSADLSRELKAGIYRGPLHGIPVAVKDIVAVKGVAMTAGSRILSGEVPVRSAEVVRALESAGAVIVGTTNLHEFASGATNVNPHFGMPANPWKEGRVPGGSSGGSAVSVAAGLVPLAVGTDTSGSVRLPSALCGVVGLKPSYPAVSKEGVFPLAPSLDTVGFHALSVWDVALTLSKTTSSPDLVQRSDPFRLPSSVGSVVRLGYLRSWVEGGVDPEVERAAESFVRDLEARGFEVVEAELPDHELFRRYWYLIRRVEASEVHEHWVLERPEDYGPDVRRMLEEGLRIRAVDYVRAMRMRDVMRGAVESMLRELDALVLPATPITAPEVGLTKVKVGGKEVDVYSALLSFTMPFNLTGHPAIVLPYTLSSEGLPISMQLVGRYMQDHELLAVALAVERALDLKTRFKELRVRTSVPSS